MAKWETAKQFIEATYHKSYDMDNYPKEHKWQCWDYADFFWVKQVGRSFITKPGGNGCARDCWTVSKKTNAGKEFDLITDKKQLKIGDWVILNSGKYGHVAMVQEIGTKGVRLKLQGQNQGKILKWVNRVWFNIDKSFLGAFRYKKWTSNNSITYTVKKGDTLWAIAAKYHTTIAKLVKDNKIKNANLIIVGQKIKINY